MKLKLFFSLSFALCLFSVRANIICPPDINLTCHDDISYLPLVGTPTVLGGSGQLRYQDVRPNSVCNIGHVVRTWYLDVNGNQQFDLGEHACIQNIYLSYTPSTTTIDWPADRVLTCSEQIPVDNPTWVSGPCDIVGISKQDQIFETDTKACYKIFRTFTVINWCTHVPGTSTGIWTHTQVIKIEDPSRPTIKNCNLVTIGTDVGCQATFSVTNSATDFSPCGQQLLLWSAEVDLWSDGSVEYTFSHNNPDETFRLDSVRSGQGVILTLPYSVIRGYHKVTWRVHDQCGNAASCEQKVWVKDTKKPTPYLHDIITSAFEGDANPLKVQARIFNIGSFDNCTKSNALRYSFSKNVNDTIRTVDCKNAGFQFYTVYVTDYEGNQESVDVYMLVFDNGSCNGVLRMAGSVSEVDGTPVSNVQLKLSRTLDPNMEMISSSDQQGSFEWSDIALYKDMIVEPSYSMSHPNRVDVADLKMLQDYIFGSHKFKNFQFVAADLNQDNKLKINDLQLLKDQILRPDLNNGNNWRFSCDIDSITGLEDLAKIKDKLILAQTDGQIDFKAVYKGDITDANEKVSGIRSKKYLASKTSDYEINYEMLESMQLYGLQITMKLPEDIGDFEVVSDYFNVNNASSNLESDGVLRFVITESIFVDENTTLFSIKHSGAKSGIVPDLLSGSKLLLDDYKTLDIRLAPNINEGDEHIFTPNPFSESFTIYGDGVEVLGVSNISGIAIPYTLEGQKVTINTLHTGFMIVQFKVNQQIYTKKLVKI